MRDSSPSRRLVKWADLSLTRKGLIVAALPLIILMGSLIALFTAFAAETRAEDELRRAFAIQRDMHEVHALLAEAGSGVREHLLTGNTSALEPFREAQAELPALLTRLDAEIEDRDVQAAFDVFLTLADQKITGLTTLAGIRENNPTPSLRSATIAGTLDANRFVLDELRVQIDEVQRLEARLLEQRQTRVEQVREQFLMMIALSGLVGVLGSLLAIYLFSTGIVRRVKRLSLNAEQLQRGAPLSPLPEDADEIGQLSIKLERASALLRAREQDLMESEERFRLVVDSVRDYGIFALDPSGIVVSWNRGAERIKGWQAEEILGEHFQVFYPAETRTHLPAEMLERAKRDGAAEDEGWRVRKDGTPFWANVVITALRDENGELKGFAKVTRDMTERKRGEEALKSAREDAIAANLAKTEFLSRTSHELRTPMNAILGFAQVLELDQESLAPDHQMALTQILKAGRHLLSLINDLLDLSSIEAGRTDIEIETLALKDIIDEACGLAEPLLHNAGLKFARPYQVEDIHVRGDRRRIVQVMLNLLTNAAKYNRTGKSVSLAARLNEDVAMIEIIDDGPGIADANVSRLFTPFDRLGSQKVKGIEGTGLGLALSKQLVESMGGKIGFRNRAAPETGAVFWFTLNLAPQPVKSPEPS